jgi:hypothetical protein
MVNNLIKIPQYENTAWFNTIIMAIIYSKYSRNLLLKKSLLSDRIEPLAILLNQLLRNDKNLKIDLNTFKLLKPSVELLRYLNMDTKINEYIYKNSWHSWMFLINFLRYLNTSYLSLDYYNNNLYFGVRDNLNFNILSKNIMYNDYEPFTNNYADKALNKLIKSNPNPNYICVNVWGQETYNDSYVKYLRFQLSKENLSQKLNIDSYKSIKYEGIKELKEEIIYNNYRYKLDSVILDDYKDVGNNSDFGLHNRYGIAGITDEHDVKFMYNGKSRIIEDNEYNLIYLNKDKILPCEYMEYKWDVRNYKRKILVSKSLCKKELRTISPQLEDVYYFGRGTRTLIYVKQEKIQKSKTKSNSELKNREKIERREKKKELKELKLKKQELKDKIKEINTNIEKKKIEISKIKKT